MVPFLPERWLPACTDNIEQRQWRAFFEPSSHFMFTGLLNNKTDKEQTYHLYLLGYVTASEWIDYV